MPVRILEGVPDTEGLKQTSLSNPKPDAAVDGNAARADEHQGTVVVYCDSPPGTVKGIAVPVASPRL